MNDIQKIVKLKHLLRGTPIKIGLIESIFGDDFIKSMEDKQEIIQHQGNWILLE